jgi:hypothetical protein
MATFKIYLDVKITDKDGKVHKHRRVRCHSFVRQMMDIMAIQMGQDSRSIKDYLAATDNASSHSGAFDVYGLAANQLFGIVVGSGTTAVGISDYVMESIIPNGQTGTQLLYGACCVGRVAIVGTSATFVIDRTFVNHSGGTIDVHEVGIYNRYQASARYFLLEHTLHDISIADGAYVNVTYTITVTV